MKDLNMIPMSLKTNCTILAVAFTLMATVSAFAQDVPQVVDPISGDTVAITSIDVEALTDEQRQYVGDQLREMGIGPRGERPEAGEDDEHPGVGEDGADHADGRSGEGRGGEGGGETSGN